MGKKGTVYIVIIIATIAILMLLQYNKPKKLNWFPSYVAQHKIPYGTLVLNDIMEKLFPENIEQITRPPFEFIDSNTDIEGTYLFINDEITFSEAELNKLLDWTTKGNTLFITSNSLEEQLLDTLNLKTSSLFAGFGDKNSHIHQLVHPQLKTDGYIFKKDNYVTVFTEIDTLNTIVLGIVDNYNDSTTIKENHINAIQQPFGEGKIILSTFPKAFTNYFILKDNNKNYTAGLLSYINGSKTIYIDNHYKSGKSFYTSPMYIFLNTKEFKWAYYIVLIAIVLYVFFEGKRKQRAIPIVSPLKNQTLAFTRTIADMYFEKSEQKPIIAYKIEQFLEHIRSHFYLSTLKYDDEFYNNLASRSSHSFDEIKSIFTYIGTLSNQEQVSDISLKKLNTLIEKFKKQSNT